MAAALAAGMTHKEMSHKDSPAKNSARKRRFSDASTGSDDTAVRGVSSTRRRHHHGNGNHRAPLAEVAEPASPGHRPNASDGNKHNPWRKRDDEGRLHRALRRARDNDRSLPRLVSRDSSPEPDVDKVYTDKVDDKPVIVMVGNKAVVPKGRDIAHNRRKPLRGSSRGDAVGRHPGRVELQVRRRGDDGVHLSPVQRVYHLSPRTLRLTSEDAKRRETSFPAASATNAVPQDDETEDHFFACNHHRFFLRGDAKASSGARLIP